MRRHNARDGRGRESSGSAARGAERRLHSNGGDSRSAVEELRYGELAPAKIGQDVTRARLVTVDDDGAIVIELAGIQCEPRAWRHWSKPGVLAIWQWL